MDVSPLNQNIDTLFSNTTYYIDFYQRQYKWDSVPVIRLLDDVFYKFTEEHKRFAQSSIPSDQIITKYSWYYMNTYVTNLDEESNRLYIVDGQQRLTTLTLILITTAFSAQPTEQEVLSMRALKPTLLFSLNRSLMLRNHIKKTVNLFTRHFAIQTSKPIYPHHT